MYTFADSYCDFYKAFYNNSVRNLSSGLFKGCGLYVSGPQMNQIQLTYFLLPLQTY